MRTVTLKWPEEGDNYEDEEYVSSVAHEYRPSALNPLIYHRKKGTWGEAHCIPLSYLTWDEENQTWRAPK